MPGLKALSLLAICSGSLLRGLGVGQTPFTPVFNDADRTRVLDFWAQPGRYQVGAPDNASQVGLYQVRLTVNGSTWLWNYAHVRGLGKVPPTQDPGAGNNQQQVWENWINAKVAYDRARAEQNAEDANQKLFGRRISTTTNPLEVAAPNPGPCPTDLATLAGDPPTFAEATVPNQYTIKFDDATLIYQDHVKMRPRYAYYRFERGVNSEGISVKTMSVDRIDHLFRLAGVDASCGRIMRAVSVLEGGFDSINTYDTGYVSVGFIQYASLKEGGGSLGRMLLDYKTKDFQDFDRDFRRFGVDVSPTGVLAVLDPDTGVELQGVGANAKIIDDKRLIAVFQRAGLKSDAFMATQIASARAQFFPAEDTLSVTLDGNPISVRVGDLVKSEAGMAILMDRKVNTGKLDPLGAIVQQVADEHDAKNLNDLCKYEGEIVTRVVYRKNYLADNSLSQPALSRGASEASRHSGRKGRGN